MPRFERVDHAELVAIMNDDEQPLKPGSATRRLADALGTQELSAGEKTGSRDGRQRTDD